MCDGFGLVTMSVRGFSGFLGTIAVRIRIIPVRVVVVRSAGIDGIENDAENAALTLCSKSRVRVKASLGVSPLANDEQHTVCLHGKNDGIGGGHNGRRIDDDEFELRAQLGDGLDELCGRRANPRDWGGRGPVGMATKLGIVGCGTDTRSRLENAGEIGTEARILAAG